MTNMLTVESIVNQWLELKVHLLVSKQNEKYNTSEILYAIHNEFFCCISSFLNYIFELVQNVLKLFQSKNI